MPHVSRVSTATISLFASRATAVALPDVHLTLSHSAHDCTTGAPTVCCCVGSFFFPWLWPFMSNSTLSAELYTVIFLYNDGTGAGSGHGGGVEPLVQAASTTGLAPPPLGLPISPPAWCNQQQYVRVPQLQCFPGTLVLMWKDQCPQFGICAQMLQHSAASDAPRGPLPSA